MHLLLLLVLPPTDRYLEDLREAIDRTAAGGYAYEVKGRFDRTGTFLQEEILTSRIKLYRSVRHGKKVLVYGPEGLWRTPRERLGERVENPDPDAPRIVRTLEEATPPHVVVARLLDRVTKGRKPELRQYDGVACRRYLLAFPRKVLEESLGRQLKKAVRDGELAEPEKVFWSSARGRLLVYVTPKDGRLFRVLDHRSVRVSWDESDERPKSYRLVMEYRFSEREKDRPSIPPEVRKRLGIEN